MQDAMSRELKVKAYASILFRLRKLARNRGVITEVEVECERLEALSHDECQKWLDQVDEQMFARWERRNSDDGGPPKGLPSLLWFRSQEPLCFTRIDTAQGQRFESASEALAAYPEEREQIEGMSEGLAACFSFDESVAV